MNLKLKTWKTNGGCQITRILAGRSNVFLISDNNRNILIDTSIKLNQKKLFSRLRALGINHLDALVLTHTHFDHAANAYQVKEKFKAKIIVHQTEAAFLESGKSPIPNGTNVFTSIIVKLFSKMALSIFKSAACNPDILVDSFLDLKEFGFNATIIHTPGHSCGSVSIIVDNEIALVGDTLFGVFKNSVYPPFADDTAELIESWYKLLKNNCSVFLPSHGNEKSREQLLAAYNSCKKSKTEYNKIPDKP